MYNILSMLVNLHIYYKIYLSIFVIFLFQKVLVAFKVLQVYCYVIVSTARRSNIDSQYDCENWSVETSTVVITNNIKCKIFEQMTHTTSYKLYTHI